MKHFLHFLLAFVATCCQTTLAATLASPQLNLILPRGIQRGHEHVMEFRGTRLADAEEIFLYDSPGIEIKNLEAINPTTVRVTMRVDRDCRIGEHLAQIRTRSGVSDFRSFFVSALPGVDETEPNNQFDQAQRIQLNHIVDGICDREDIDRYIVACEENQRLTVEIQGMRLGATFFDPVITVADRTGTPIAHCDDTPLAQQDAVISLKIPAAGDYVISVKEAANRGNGNARYRLHVGDFPRPTLAFPAGGKINQPTEVKLLGDGIGELSRTIWAAENAADPDATYKLSTSRHELTIDGQHGCTPTPLAFRASKLDNVLESEPNNNFAQANDCSLPTAINGIVHAAGEKDWYKFSAQKDVTYEFELFAHRINSRLDAVINLFNSDRKHLVGNDDSRQLDPFIRWRCPADGDYFLRVYDRRDRGDSDFVYRVEASQVTPQLTVAIPRVDRYSQKRQSIVVPRGGRFATRFSVTRQNFSGPVELDTASIPPNIMTATSATDGNQNIIVAVFEAAPDAPLGGQLVDLTARHVEQDQIHGGYVNVADFVLGQPNNTRYIAGITKQVPVVVAERLPFRLKLDEPQVPLLRDGNLKIKIIADRDEGFNKPIRLEFPHRPSGIGTVGSVTIPAGKNEAEYPINANSKTKIGTHPVYVIGSANVDGPAWQSTQLAPIEVAERFLTVNIKPSACEQGQSVSVVCTIDRLTDFSGKAVAELAGLPPHATSPPIEITPDDTQIVFQVQTSKQTPVGKHRGLFCRVTVTDERGSMPAVAGRGEIQVDHPLRTPTPNPNSIANASQPAQPTLSRLEKIRLDAKRRREKILNPGK